MSALASLLRQLASLLADLGGLASGAVGRRAKNHALGSALASSSSWRRLWK